MDLPGVGVGLDIVGDAGGGLYLAFSTEGAAIAAGITTVTNSGSADAQPHFIVTGPALQPGQLFDRDGHRL